MCLEPRIWRLASGLVFVHCLIFPDAGNAAYVIRLKNGNEFVTTRYWQEGKQVMFDTYGGTFGVDKAFVIKIEESNKPVKQLAAPESTHVQIPTAPSGTEEDRSKSPAPEAKTGPVRKSDPIIEDLDSLKHRFQTLDGMSVSDLQEFLKDVTSIRRRIQASGRSNDYLGEFTRILEMGDAAETLLRSRR
jgi:hypothetical protein